jgi:hypothetical protein
VASALDLVVEALNYVRRADRLPVRLGEGIEGQASRQVALEALDGRGIGLGVFFAESHDHLIGLGASALVEDGLELQLDQVALLVGYVAEHVVHFVLDTALAGRLRELELDRVQHGLVAIGNPQVNLLDPARLESPTASSKSSQAPWFSRSPTVKARTSRSPFSLMPMTAKMGTLRVWPSLS